MSGSYKLLKPVIGKGSFGIVYLGIHDDGQLVAVKIENKDGKSQGRALCHENAIIKAATANTRSAALPQGIIRSRHFWEDQNRYYMVTDLMGPSIDALHKLCDRSFSLKTTLMLAEQMISLVKYYHQHDIIHRDIKPANFLINYTLPHRYITLIDFGLAKKYRIKGKLVPFASGATQVGTLRYMSRHIHNSLEASRRDDMYSLGYCIVFLFTGMLPWQGEIVAKMRDRAKRRAYVTKLKSEVTNTDLVVNCKCLSCARSGDTCSFVHMMRDYFNYLDSLEYESQVDYDMLLSKLKACFKTHGFVHDHRWDWDKYYRLH